MYPQHLPDRRQSNSQNAPYDQVPQLQCQRKCFTRSMHLYSVPGFHTRQDGIIVNLMTGETVGQDIFEASDHKILSCRQVEILSLIAKGIPSKLIADKLSISIYTVNRHRQDILARLKVTNTAAAVEIALRMNLI